MWKRDLIDHVRVELDAIIALSSMTSIVKTNVYKLYPMDGKSPMTSQ